MKVKLRYGKFILDFNAESDPFFFMSLSSKKVHTFADQFFYTFQEK